ncbi:hypothetical protein ACOMHN_045859 [Nucella lapillus]
MPVHEQEQQQQQQQEEGQQQKAPEGNTTTTTTTKPKPPAETPTQPGDSAHGPHDPLPQPPPPESPMPVVWVDGVPIPKMFEHNRPLEEHVKLLKDLEMRQDDVVMVAYAKSGTHWLWEVTSMLVAGKAQYEKRSKVFSMLDTSRIEDIRALPSPRVLNSHFPVSFLPRQVKDKGVKVVHVYRNVKDVMVSLYFHFLQTPGGAGLDFPLMERLFLSDNVPMGNFFAYMNEMREFRENNPEIPFFLVSFEDTKENPEKVIGDLGRFLGVEASPQLIRDIAQVTHFAKMKQADKKKLETHIPPADIFRKGEVGDWKNYLTVAQSERLDAAMMQLQSCDYYNFRYEL